MCTFCPIPTEQQPLNEYQILNNSVLFNWPSQKLKIYFFYLFTIYSIGFLLTFLITFYNDLFIVHPVNIFVHGIIGGNFVLILDLLRLYLGWSYICQRLLSATVSYEESGWYDGQIWVKSSEVLIQDRLIGIYQVRPVLNRLKQTLGVVILILGFTLLIQ
uniref:Uncharacterized protein ycf36 n=1 Tax=Cyanophora paradoxa TaxID=2762 RepID=YCF36_CYAPA|nr:hypothetical protein CypaCp074 [Cyanophora paradoxa]P48276.1 RecName: Full=Uncharacterized protein ycf36 [Cyanophora paradoxa]AAA81242.1 ycf36 [Cyanophora paradoxa]